MSRVDILNGNYRDPLELDVFAENNVDAFANDVDVYAQSLKESSVKYMRKRKNLQNEDYDAELEEEPKYKYSAKRNFRTVKGVKEPWTEDQSFVWPDYEAEAFEKDLEQFRQRPESNTGYENKALNKKMVDKYGDQAKKCINNTLFKESRTRKPLKESKKPSALLKQYEKDCGWYFVQNEDVDDLVKIVEALEEVGNTYFNKYGYVVADKKAKSDEPKSLYLEVNGYGRRNAVKDYRIMFATSDTDGYDFLKDWCRANHLGYNWTYKDRIEKQLQKLFKTSLENVCESLGFEITDIGFRNCKAYDSNYYAYVDLKPTKRLNALNNAPTDKKLQRVLDTIVEDTKAKLLIEVEDTKYWKIEGYEGAEVIFTTCLTTDKVDVYPSDDDVGYSENPNFNKPILYLDIPNTGYCNWNSGTGYIEDRDVRDIDAIERVAEKFISKLEKVGREVYSNSNY